MDIKKGWQRWLEISQKSANIFGRIIITIFYFTIMLPFSIGVTLLGDPLKLKVHADHHWLDREALSDDLESARRQS
ncbi:MAG: hypothetical protein AAF629_00680 [Chloroflexota bacterium]